MDIIKSIMYANFEEPRSRDRDSGTLSLRKVQFLSRKFINSLIAYKFAERGTLKFEHNVDAVRDCMHTKFGGAQSRDRDFSGRKSSKSGRV